VVFLKDVKFDHLQALVDYMYRGEVGIKQLKTREHIKNINKPNR